MPQQFLNGPEVGPRIHQIRRKGMSERMNALPFDSSRPVEPVNPPLHAPGRQPGTPTGEEQGLAIAPNVAEQGLASLEVPPKRRLGLPAYRNNPLFPALTSHPNLIREQIEISKVGPGEFREA